VELKIIKNVLVAGALTAGRLSALHKASSSKGCEGAKQRMTGKTK